ncbi:MAG: hypothetical protein H6623_02270 [Bdellovibrionaceae bacterium]|nr:hypothetical protein [Pseudobdellovibrionaceae bacterium]
MMSKTILRKILIPLLFTALILFAINIQCTVWYDLFGDLPPIVLWPAIFVYLFTTREWRDRTLWLVVFFILLTSYSVAIPLWVFLSLCTLGALIRFIQKRFAALATSDLVIFSVLSVFTYPIVYATFSSIGAMNFTFNLWSHIFSTLISIPFIPPILFMGKKIDRVLNIEDEGLLFIKL